MKLMEEGRSVGLQKQEGLQYFLVVTQLYLVPRRSTLVARGWREDEIYFPSIQIHFSMENNAPRRKMAGIYEGTDQ